jgi:hypothetical protein
MAEPHTQAVSPASAKLGLPPDLGIQLEQLEYAEFPKSSPSVQDQSQNEQGMENITASPTFIKSTEGDYNVNQQLLDPTVSHSVLQYRYAGRPK